MSYSIQGKELQIKETSSTGFTAVVMLHKNMIQ